MGWDKINFKGGPNFIRNNVSMNTYPTPLLRTNTEDKFIAEIETEKYTKSLVIFFYVVIN